MASVLGNKKKCINDLPENLLLEIFHYLPVKELCTSGRVCRSWRRVARDNSLWRHVNLIPYRLNLHRMWRVIRAHFSDVLLSLRIQGYMHKDVKNWNKPTVSDAMLRDLRERCPGMRVLQLVHVNLTGVNSATLSSSLHTLNITHSRLPARWFQAAVEAKVLPELRHLDLSLSTMTSSADLKDVVTFTGLTLLKMNGCYRVKEDGLRMMAESLGDMKVLELSEAGCTDLALHHIGRGMPKLEHLSLAACTQITDGGIACLAACLKQLTSLNLHQCSPLTDSVLEPLSKLTKLRRVDARCTKLTEAALKKLPKCEVVLSVCKPESEDSS